MPAFTMPGSLRGKNDSYWFPVVAFNQYIHYKVWLVKNFFRESCKIGLEAVYLLCFRDPKQQSRLRFGKITA